MAWAAALRLGGSVEMEVVGVDWPIGIGAFCALGCLALAEVLVAVVRLVAANCMM